VLVLLFLEHPGISVFGLIDNFAQEDELTENPRVGGSIPPLATIIHKAFSFLVVSIFSFGEHNITASPSQYFTEEVFVPCARPCCAWGGAGRPT
jgi:hypothetical protein